MHVNSFCYPLSKLLGWLSYSDDFDYDFLYGYTKYWTVEKCIYHITQMYQNTTKCRCINQFVNHFITTHCFCKSVYSNSW